MVLVWHSSCSQSLQSLYVETCLYWDECRTVDLWVAELSRYRQYVASHPGQLSLAILPWVDTVTSRLGNKQAHRAIWSVVLQLLQTFENTFVCSIEASSALKILRKCAAQIYYLLYLLKLVSGWGLKKWMSAQPCIGLTLFISVIIIRL